MATQMDTGEQREQLMRLAAQWRGMAEDRAALIARHPELAYPEAREEDQTVPSGGSGG